MSANLENSAVATGQLKYLLVFIPITKKGNAKGCSNYCAIALVSHASKVMLKILQTRLQQYMHQELPDVQAGFRKDRGTRDIFVGNRYCQYPLDHRKSKRITEKKKKTYICFIDYTKAFDCVDHNKMWKILKKVGIPDHLTCPLKNLYAGQEAIVRTIHGTMAWFPIGKGVHQDCILSPYLFNLYV